MTIKEAIAITDRLTPNQYEWEDKVRWLSELDGVAYREVLLTHELEAGAFRAYTPDTDPDTELLIESPYDEAYRWYLDMKIAEANGEGDRYNASAGSYNQYYTAWANFINRSFLPRMPADHFRL